MTQHPTPTPPPESGRAVAAELPKRPAPPPPGAHPPAESHTVTGELDVTAAGLDPEQEIRARALAAATRLAAVGKLAASDDLDELLDFADELAAYVRTGARP